MKTVELQARASALLELIGAAADDVRGLRDGAQYDEDYKIAEWGQQLTVERFERARLLAEELGVVVDELRLRKRMPYKQWEQRLEAPRATEDERAIVELERAVPGFFERPKCLGCGALDGLHLAECPWRG